jgi:hypothetical protein
MNPLTVMNEALCVFWKRFTLWPPAHWPMFEALVASAGFWVAGM